MKNTLFIPIIFLSLSFSQALAQGSGYSLNFDGNDYVQVSTLNTQQLYSISFWFKPNATVNTGTSGAGRNLVTFEDNPTSAFGDLELTLGPITSLVSGEVITLSDTRGGSQRRTAVRNITIEPVWHHLSMVWNTSANHYDFYLDGILQTVSSSSAGHVGLVTIDELNIGRRQLSGSSSLFFNGQIDEVRIWDRSLTETEIRTNMCKKLTGSEAGLVAYYRMDEGADNTCSGGEDVCDLTGNNNHGVKF